MHLQVYFRWLAAPKATRRSTKTSEGHRATLLYKTDATQRRREISKKMYTNPFNRKHSTIRQVLDRLLDPTRKPIRRSESVSSSGSSTSKSSNRSWNESNHSHRGILQWGRK
uniref:Uncharacterized protein n=1 Tax=Vespula pensylvanica TaxID=30213 RepID=A0A834K421_VESPE|nr:hypothetical protein H0235_015781 [Vespula pensylvanica]